MSFLCTKKTGIDFSSIPESVDPLMGLAFTVLFHLLSIFMAWLDGAGSFGQLLGLPANLKNSLVAGGVWTLLMLGVAWHRLKVIDD